jgi:hypothetical protein
MSIRTQHAEIVPLPFGYLTSWGLLSSEAIAELDIAAPDRSLASALDIPCHHYAKALDSQAWQTSCFSMEHRGVQYQVDEMTAPPAFVWTVHLDETIRIGVSFSKENALFNAPFPQPVAVEDLAAEARHQGAGLLRPHPLASYPHGVFPFGPVTIVAPCYENRPRSA